MEKEKNEEYINIKSYYVDNNLKTILQENKIPYKILIHKEKFEKINIKSKNITISNKTYLNIEKEEVIKLEIKNKELYEYILEQTKENKIPIYEADLSAEHKYLIDKKIKINSPKSEILPKLKYISIDIETIKIQDSEEQEIVLISSFSPHNEKIKKVYINEEKICLKKIKEIKQKQDLGFEVVFLKNEKKMIEEFQKNIIEYSPQLIVGWNVIDFDFKIIKQRIDKYNLKFEFSKFKGKCNLKLNSDFFIDSSMNCPGIVVFDIIQIIKSNYIIFKDYKLNTVAKEILKDEKIDLNIENDSINVEDKFKLIEKTLKENPLELIKYNFKDSLLVSKIIEKLNLLKLVYKRSIITQTPIKRIKSPIACLDNMYLKKLHEKGYVANSNFNFKNTNQIEGAFVIEPEKQLSKDIFVFDFKSLYPSIIMTFNIDPFKYTNKEETDLILAPNGAKFKKDKGILPELILKLYKERDLAKKENDIIKSKALKITMNSFYGAMASPKSRYHNRDVGGAITSFGREIIKKTKSFIENKNLKVIYGDTDSIFVKIENLENKNLNEKIKIGNEIKDEINKYFNLWVKNEFKQKNYLEIELDKIYSHFFISSKKRYVGYNQIKNKINFVGLEAVRGDWTEVAKKFQRDIVKLIFENNSKEEIKIFILKYISKLKNGELNELLIYNKKLTKPLIEYTKTTPPHVKAARELENFNDRLVKYVLTKDGPKHISKINLQTKYDYDHYIEKQLKSVSEDILKLYGLNFEEIVNKINQKSLSDFW